MHRQHHHYKYEKQSFELMLNRISLYYDEPFGDYSNFPTYEISRVARNYVTVVLSGDGGDEIFGGYTMHQAAARVSFLQKVMPKPLRWLVHKMLPRGKLLSFRHKVKEAFRLSLFPKEDFYAEVYGDFVYKPNEFKLHSRARMKEMLETCKGNLTEAVIRYDLYYHTLADNFLVKVDRASMANGLEVRSPFLDYRFLELEAKIPVKWKVTPFKTKVLMHEVIKDMLPKKIVNRDKKGFQPPIPDWIWEYKDYIVNDFDNFAYGTNLSDDWKLFYKKVFKSKPNEISTGYLIRLFLLMKWSEGWVWQLM